MQNDAHICKKFSIHAIGTHINDWALTYTYTVCWIYSGYMYIHYIATANRQINHRFGVLSRDDSSYVHIPHFSFDLFGQLSLLLLHIYYTRHIKKSIKTPLLTHDTHPGTRDCDIKLPEELATTYPYMWIYMINIIFINLHYIVKMGTQLNIIGILEQYIGTVFESEVNGRQGVSLYRPSTDIVFKKLVLFIFSGGIHLISIYLYIIYIIDLKLYSRGQLHTPARNDIEDNDTISQQATPVLASSQNIFSTILDIGSGEQSFNDRDKIHFIIVVLLGTPLLIDQYITTYNITFILRNSSVGSPETLPIPVLGPSSGIATILAPSDFNIQNPYVIGNELSRYDNIILSNINILTFYLFAVIALFKSTYKCKYLVYFILLFQNIFITNVSVYEGVAILD